MHLKFRLSKSWQDYLQKAVEHLGHEKDSVRISGAHELFLLAQNNEESRQTIFDILCAHIRQTTGESKYRETHTSKPSEEIQNLLTLLFIREHEFFKGLHINLEGSWLNGADLRPGAFSKGRLDPSASTESQSCPCTSAKSQFLRGTTARGFSCMGRATRSFS